MVSQLTTFNLTVFALNNWLCWFLSWDQPFPESSNWTGTSKWKSFCTWFSTQSPKGTLEKIWNLPFLLFAEHISNWSAHQVEFKIHFHLKLDNHQITLLLWTARTLTTTIPRLRHAPHRCGTWPSLQHRILALFLTYMACCLTGKVKPNLKSLF